jgi:hypothetical protein
MSERQCRDSRDWYYSFFVMLFRRCIAFGENTPCATSICSLTKVICTFGCSWPESNCDDSEVRSQRKKIVIVHNIFSFKPRARFRPSIVPLPHVYRKPRLLNDHLLHRSACPISISFNCSSTLFDTCLAINVSSQSAKTLTWYKRTAV